MFTSDGSCSRELTLSCWQSVVIFNFHRPVTCQSTCPQHIHLQKSSSMSKLNHNTTDYICLENTMSTLCRILGKIMVNQNVERWYNLFVDSMVESMIHSAEIESFWSDNRCHPRQHKHAPQQHGIRRIAILRQLGDCYLEKVQPSWRKNSHIATRLLSWKDPAFTEEE